MKPKYSYKGKASELVPGKMYNSTACCNQKVLLIAVREIDENGNALIEIKWRNNYYIAASGQLYTR